MPIRQHNQANDTKAEKRVLSLILQLNKENQKPFGNTKARCGFMSISQQSAMKSFKTKLLKHVTQAKLEKINKFKHQVKQITSKWHGIVVIAPSIAGLTIFIRMLG